jgi:hypothetical protein
MSDETHFADDATIDYIAKLEAELTRYREAVRKLKQDAVDGFELENTHSLLELFKLLEE